MRRTRKLVAAHKVAHKAGVQLIDDPPTMYHQMEAAGWFWFPDDGEWRDEKPLTSICETADEAPTGIVRFQIMAHPGDVERAVSQVKRHFMVANVSEPYPNRKGPGVRVYVTVKLPAE